VGAGSKPRDLGNDRGYRVAVFGAVEKFGFLKSELEGEGNVYGMRDGDGDTISRRWVGG
jgi:hypothetical protein